MPSGRLVCRCHDVFLWCYVCVVLLRFCLYDVVEAAALRSIVLRYASAPTATRVSFAFFGDAAFSEYFFVPFPLSLCMESTSYVLSFRTVFFYLVTTGWIFYISLCENSINQSSGANLYPPGGCRVVFLWRYVCFVFVSFSSYLLLSKAEALPPVVPHS